MPVDANPASKDVQRIASPSRQALCDAPCEPQLERIAQMATQALRVPVAALCVHTLDRGWFKAIAGLARQDVPSPDVFCEVAFCAPGSMAIGDPREDPRDADHAAVATALHVRFIAASPLFAPDGQRIGGICVFDFEARKFDEEMTRTLAGLARLAETALYGESITRAQSAQACEPDEARRRTLRDNLTQTWNRAGILEILSREIARAGRRGNRLGVALVDLDRFKVINDQHGHLIGDRVLRMAAERMVDAVRPYDAVGRYGGGEFLIVLVENESAVIGNIAERIRRNIAGTPFSTVHEGLQVTASVGVACPAPQSGLERDHYLQIAREALRGAKRAGRDRVVMSDVVVAGRP